MFITFRCYSNPEIVHMCIIYSYSWMDQELDKLVVRLSVG